MKLNPITAGLLSCVAFISALTIPVFDGHAAPQPADAEAIKAYQSSLASFTTNYKLHEWYRPFGAGAKETIAAEMKTEAKNVVLLEGDYDLRVKLTKTPAGTVKRTEAVSERDAAQKTLVPDLLILALLKGRTEQFMAREVAPNKYLTQGTITEPGERRNEVTEPILHLLGSSPYRVNSVPDVTAEGEVIRDDGTSFDVKVVDKNSSWHVWKYERLPGADGKFPVRVAAYYFGFGDPVVASEAIISVDVLDWEEFQGFQVPKTVTARGTAKNDAGERVVMSKYEITEAKWEKPSQEAVENPGIAFPKGTQIIDMINNKHFATDRDNWRYASEGL